MASLFLSYSREDMSRVAPLAAALERDGHTVWWDRHISGGQEFADAIEQALESADVVIVCWTANSVRSAWVRDEAGAGRDRGRLVPVTLDGCQPPLGFRQYHTIDLSRWNGRPQSPALEPLKAAIAERASGTPQPMRQPSHRGSLRAPASGRGAGPLLAAAALVAARGRRIPLLARLGRPEQYRAEGRSRPVRTRLRRTCRAGCRTWWARRSSPRSARRMRSR